VPCGMAYAMQAQICKGYRLGGSAALAFFFFDGFGLWAEDSIAVRYFVAEAVELVMASAESQAAAAAEASSLLCAAAASGNPSLQGWTEGVGNHTLMRSTRRQVYGSSGSGSSGGSSLDNVIGVVFAGGYGSGYDNSLRLFCDTALSLAAGGGTDMRFVFSPHPGYRSPTRRGGAVRRLGLSAAQPSAARERGSTGIRLQLAAHLRL
jgi:hypothetical protein